MFALLTLLQLAASAPQPAAAVATESTKHSTLCWRARPAPRCQWFLVTELGMARSSRDAYNPRVDLALGLMRNVGRRAAIGASVLASADESHSRSGFIVRYRRWLDPRIALEIGVGPIQFCELQGPQGCGPVRQSGVQVETAVHLSGLVAATATFEHLGGRRLYWPTGEFAGVLPEQNRVYLGMKGGAYAAPLALLALGVLVGATWE